MVVPTSISPTIAGKLPDAPPGRIHATIIDPRGLTGRGVIEEMSPIDLRLFIAVPFKVGSMVNVRLSPEGWKCHFDVNGIVHRSEQLAGGADVGIFLSQALSEELVSACWLEMRRELRYPAIWSLWARSEAHQKVIAATVMNYSYSGLQIRMPHAAQPGEQVCLLSDEPIADATVRWVAPFNSTESICGCQVERGDGLKLALRLQLRPARRN